MYPEVFRIGPFVVRYYGLMYVIALLVGIVLLRLEAKRRARGRRSASWMRRFTPLWRGFWAGVCIM